MTTPHPSFATRLTNAELAAAIAYPDELPQRLHDLAELAHELSTAGLIPELGADVLEQPPQVCSICFRTTRSYVTDRIDRRTTAEKRAGRPVRIAVFHRCHNCFPSELEHPTEVIDAELDHRWELASTEDRPESPENDETALSAIDMPGGAEWAL